MQIPQTLVHCMDINTWDDSSFEEHYLPFTNEPNKNDVSADKLSKPEFEKMSCTNDDFDNDGDDEWIGKESQNLVNEFSSNFYTTSVEKKRDPGEVTILRFIGLY